MGKKTLLEVTLTEGKNREIRILMDFIYLQVIELKRVTFGPYSLGSLRVNQIEPVSTKDLHSWLGDRDDKNLHL
jgi:23S rRNA pseudouridine2605 synthase